ncbi:MAG: hypothetical protein NZ959_01205 [Armatimonadetes bacterium]|nr:hypothetical protein [Armatimonadota bacterium]MDW8121869.1 hypothetical protein [Armatimonadota bacterium]
MRVLKEGTGWVVFTAIFLIVSPLAGQSWYQLLNNDAYNRHDYANVIALDGLGNVYSAGTSWNGEVDGYVIWIVKQASDGSILWRRTLSPGGVSSGAPSSIAMSPDGQAFYIGTSGGVNYGADFLTVKYSADGTRQWLRYYNGTADAPDGVAKVVVDRDGNAIVVGSAAETGRGSDIVTIKYSPDGSVLWLQKYNGPVSSTEYASDAVVDGDGNVYVCGASTGSTNNLDMVLLKYNRDGILQWVRRYNGPADGRDDASSLCLDPQGNIIITGSSQGFGQHGLPGSQECVTIKYRPNGSRVWIRKYPLRDWTFFIDSDQAGNIYISPESLRPGFVILSYSPDGMLRWTFQYELGSFFADMKVTAEGYCVLAGRPLALVIDPDGRVVRAEWTLGASLGSASASAVAVSGSGYPVVYIAGSQWNESTYADYMTAKLDVPGIVSFDRGGYDSGVGAVRDREGNVYETGVSGGRGTGKDVVVRKIASDGRVLWTSIYNNTLTNGDDVVSDIAVDGAGNVYVVGTSFNGDRGKDVLVLKYGPTGVLLWRRLFGTTIAGGADEGVAIALSGDGVPFVVGHLFRSATVKTDIWLLRLDPRNGARVWGLVHGGRARGDDYGRDVAVGADLSVYVLGQRWGGDPTAGGSGYDWVLLKASGSGAWQTGWPKVIGGNGNDLPTELVLDTAGNVLATGSVWNADSRYDIATVKYTSGGALQWMNIFDGFGLDDSAAGIAVSSDSSRVCVAGSSDGFISGVDIVALWYDGSGRLMQGFLYDGPVGGDDFAVAVTEDGGKAYISGYSENLWVDYDWCVLRLSLIIPERGLLPFWRRTTVIRDG